METIENIFKSIYDSYRDRVKSPLVGSFILTFIVFNWRAFAILFYSDWPVHCRIEWIEERFWSLSYVLWPFVIAILYVILLPHINLFFEWILQWYTDKKSKKNDDKRIAQLERDKKEAKLVREIADEKAGTSEITTLKQRNEALQKELLQTAAQMNDDLIRHNNIVDQYKKTEKNYEEKIKSLIVENEFEWYKNNISSAYDIGRDKIRQVINFVSNFSDEEKKKYLDFAHKFTKDPESASTAELEYYSDLNLIDYIKIGKTMNKSLSGLGQLVFLHLTNGRDLL